MSKAKVRATFIPNGISDDSKLKYSILISLDYSPLDNDPNCEDACTFAKFISESVFDLQNVKSGTPVSINGNHGKFDCPEAKMTWNLIFNDTSNSKPELYFQENKYPQPFRTNAPLDYIPEPLKVINYFQNHYARKIFNSSSYGQVFRDELTALNTNIANQPSEVAVIKELIKNINQPPGVATNTYARRLENAEKVHISEIISFFSSYPKVLRKLGLLFSYEIDSVAIADGDKIRVQLTTPDNKTYEADNPPIPTVVEKREWFLAKTNKKDAYIKGLLNLQQIVNINDRNVERFSIVQNTAVEAAYKSDAYFNTVNKNNTPPVTTNGMYLIDNYRKQQEEDELTDRVKDELYLEDLLTGFRFDLKNVSRKEDKSSVWKSLNSKSSEYRFLKSNPPLIETDVEPGWTNTDTKAKTRKGGKDVELVADVLCHLNGWGLNSANPLQQEAQNIKVIEKNLKVSEGTGDPVHDYLIDKFYVKSKSPKSSLHPLRIGLSYQLRARLVTIDGYSISMDEADVHTNGDNPVLRTSDFKFCRLESVGAPVFVLKESIYDGDKCTLNKTVKESKRGESEYILVIRSQNNNTRTGESTIRGLAPAGISWHLAEWQNAFDNDMKYVDPSKLKRSKNYIPQIIEKGDKKYWKERAGKFIENGDKNRNVPYIIDPFSQCFEILCDENEIYSLLHSKNTDLNFWKNSFDWWNIKTWEIIVKEQRKKQTPGTIRGKNCIFSVDSWNKTVTILVSKGEDLKFKIRTFPLDISSFYNRHLISSQVNLLLDKTVDRSPSTRQAKRDFYIRKTEVGTCPIRESLLFAEKEFRVVHAIKKPLFKPRFIDNTAIQRTWNPDEISFALLTSAVFYPGKTSKKLELFATWEDKIDDGTSDELILNKFEDVYVAEYKLNGQIEKPEILPSGSDIYLLGEIEDYGQPIAKPIVYSGVLEFGKLHYLDNPTPITIMIPTAVGNEGKYLIFKNRNLGIVTIQPSIVTETIDREPTKILNETEKIQIESDGINWVLRNVSSVYADIEKLFYAKHNFGDSKHRIVEYKLKASSKFIEFFPAEKALTDRTPAKKLDEKNNNEFSVFSESIKLNIPSSQAPSAPNVAFIIPYFEWEFIGKERRRKGNRLRVYLERPWFSSGENEKIAVIISNDPNFESEGKNYQYVSKWGRDVTTFGKNLLPLTSENFVNKSFVVKNLTLNNLLFKKRAYDKPNKTITNTIERPFSAIVFEVELVKVDNKYYWSADIEFDNVEAYLPFIQLSVARYQKDSIPDEELSSSILCDFIQVAPFRTVSYSKHGSYIDLSLFGSFYKADFDTLLNKTIIKNEVYIAFIPKEHSQEGGNDILYISNGDTIDSCDWHKIEDNNITVLENGITWRFKGTFPYKNYSILIKEFETFHNNVAEINPEKNPTKRLIFGDVIEI